MKSCLSGAGHSCLVRPSHSVNAARTWRARFLSSMAGLCAGLMVVSAQAAFQVVENFDSLTLGDINGQNGWVASLNSNGVELDPAGGSNQVLKVLTESGTLKKAASVPKSATRMLFLRFRFEEHGAYSFGLSHLTNPDEYSDFGPELGMAAANAGDPGNDFRVANGLTTGIYDVLEALVPGNWYNAWVLVNHTSDTYQVWMNADPGADAQASDQLDNDAAESVFGFRTATAADLINFFIKTGGGASPVDGRFYIDDIYLENTGATNLSNPAGDAGDNTPVDLAGTVETVGGTGLCAMVLASGQFDFSCNPNGPFSLTDLPRESDGTVKRQVYVDGFFPRVDTLAGSIDETVVMTPSGTCPDYNQPYSPGVFPDSAGKRIDISGNVRLQDTQTPVCAIVLANGQYMFSCDATGSYALNIPLDANGQFKLQVYADGFAPAIQRFDEFKPTTVVGMTRAVECQ